MILSTGIDIVRNDRVPQLLESGAIFSLFSEREYSYCSRKKNILQSIGGIYAAKEAVIKCFGSGVSMKNVHIFREDTGKPYAHVDGFEGRIAISISHEKEYSVACAVVMI